MKTIRFLLLTGLFATGTFFLSRPLGKIPALLPLMHPSTGFWQNLSHDAALPQGTLHLAELVAPAQVSYDADLIPHVFAENAADAWFVQGYVHAQHRLWQMEFQVRAAGGRLAEILGPDLLEYDRKVRRKGLVLAATTSLESEIQNSNSQLALVQYANGVNAYIQSLPKNKLPIEYKLLGYEPELWTPLKSMILLTYMSDMLSTSEYDLQNTLFYNAFGADAFATLFPDVARWMDPIVNRTGNWPAAIPVTDSITDLWPRGFELPVLETSNDAPIKGSNNWVVGPSKTADSATILCNDPHLGLQMPALWFLNQLQFPGLAVKGVSLPGLPGVVLGFNDSIAWGVTNAQRDVVDWYAVVFNNAQRTTYKLDGDWVPTKKVVETIAIKGEAPFLDTVVYTRWGPVVYDVNFQPTNPLEGFAYKWISHGPTFELEHFLALNQATNMEAAHAAVDGFVATAQNFVFADRLGNYAMHISGAYPQRLAGEGRFLRDGSHSINDWRPAIPKTHQPQWSNPDRGYLASANQHPVDSTYPYYIYGVNYETYRNRRINEVLATHDSLTTTDMMRLQQDNFNYKAAEFLPWALGLMGDMALSGAAQIFFDTLASWDYYNHHNSIGAAAFELLWNAYYPNCWAGIGRYNNQLRVPASYNTLRLSVSDPENHFFDDPQTPAKETARTHLKAAFFLAAKAFAAKAEEPWYLQKNTTLRHLLRIPQFSTSEIPIGGNAGIVNANSGTHGASWRLVAHLSNIGIAAKGIYPGGQSGAVGSPFYNNFTDDWAAGNYIDLPLHPKPFGTQTITFKPKKK